MKAIPTVLQDEKTTEHAMGSKGDTLFFDTEVEVPDIPFCRVFYLLEKNVCLFVFRSDTTRWIN